MLDLSYDYDSAGNIEQIDNAASSLPNSLGGQYSYSYTYDDLYRLTNGAGTFVSEEYGSFPFETQMGYSASGNITNKDVDADLFINASTQSINYSNQYSYNDRPHTVSQAGDFNYDWDYNGNMTHRQIIENGFIRTLCWDEENRLTTVRDAGGEPPMYLSSYIYNAAGERVWKLTGEQQQMWISGDVVVNMVNFDKTLYASPYMVLTDEEYTKHYYIEGERVCSKIGGGYGNAPNDIYEPVPYLAVDPDQQSEDL